MTITTGFFDAARQYTAQEFARALRAANTPGVVQGIGNTLAVSAGPGLGVTVDTGMVTILGDWLYSDATTAIALLAADVTNPRIDRIIARLTISTKTVELTKLTGTPAGSPAAPALTQGSDVYEIPLAQIAVAANAGSITSGNVTDQRQYAGSVLTDHKHTGTAGGGGTLGRGTSTASGATITVPTDGATIPITGTTTITSINAGALGRIVTLEFASAGCQVTNGSNLKLAGNYVSIVRGTLTLESDGTNWNEIGRNDNHALAANVHGLPASVNVLGNRAAAGEFVQRGGVSMTTPAGANGSSYTQTAAVTFAVAFASTPRVVCSPSDSTGTPQPIGAGARSVTTTGFTLFGTLLNPSQACNYDYIALGS